MGELTAPTEGEVIYAVLQERAFHFSTAKELESFFMVSSLHVAPSKAIPASSYPLTLLFDLDNVGFADQVLCNPALATQREGECSFSVTLPHAAECWEVLRILVQKQFPVARVPLRLVPVAGVAQVLEVTYEMNPVVEELSVLVLEILLDGAASELAVEVVRNKQGAKLDDVTLDQRNKVVRVIVGKVARTERRNKVFVHLKEPARIVSVSCGFTAAKKAFFCQMQPRFKDARVLIDSNLKSRHYFARP